MISFLARLSSLMLFSGSRKEMIKDNFNAPVLHDFVTNANYLMYGYICNIHIDSKHTILVLLLKKHTENLKKGTSFSL